MRIQDLDNNGEIDWVNCPTCEKKVTFQNLARHKIIHKS